MFRAKESSNRIELSRLVQELLNFGVFGFLRLLGVGGGWMGWGWLGGAPPPHMHMHAHAHTHMHAHACVVNMIISCKWPHPLGESLGIPYDVIHVCVHMCVCMCMYTWVGCTLSPPPTPSTHPPHPPGGTPGIIQNSIALELIEIFQLCLKI